MGDTRFEQHQLSPGKAILSDEVQAQVQVNSRISDPELAILTDAWPTLSEATKASIMSFIEDTV
ncbi:hypothetical protein [Bythopirellula polymerisocia]|uniref:hypothetical protein n=1 Tax=Bythopirellula polymerisocia TaxID=2528003 RepID=UPI0011B63B0B|nr:hypothetical protein [Bythopirellula polymerisocia]